MMLDNETLQDLERRLADRGYSLQRHPRREALPQFLRQFQPDAIATGKTPNLLIEFITQRDSETGEAAKIERLQQALEGHPDWKLEIVYAVQSAPLLARARVESIRQRFREVRRLTDADRPAALLLAWSLLEAVARRVLPERATRALTPATTIELLTSLGHITQAEADSLRAAARARNLIAHGDVEQDAPQAELDNILGIIDGLLSHLERETSGAA